MAFVYQGLVTNPLTMLGVISSPDEEEALRAMREALNTAPHANFPFEVTDLECIRFLQARQFNVESAVEMYVAWRKWYYLTPLPKLDGRIFQDDECSQWQMYPCTILEYDIPGLSDFNSRHSLCYTMLAEDKDGSPIYWEKTGLTTPFYSSMLEDMSESDMVTLHVRQQELLVTLLHDKSIKYGKHIDKFVVISDLTGLTFSLDPAAMRMFLLLASLDSANYPERLKKLYFINAPFYFTAIWSVVWPFLNPATVSKVVILGQDYLPSLLEVIDNEFIPSEYGGNLETAWNWPENFQSQTVSIPKPATNYKPDTGTSESL